MTVEDYLAKLDRFIISQREKLENGQILTVQVDDGYILIKSEFDEVSQNYKVKTYYSAFDDKLKIPFKEILQFKTESEGASK